MTQINLSMKQIHTENTLVIAIVEGKWEKEGLEPLD